MKKITTIGIDLAKNSFQLHGVDSADKTVLQKKLARSQLLKFVANLPECLIGIEACGSAHFWAREFSKFGHTVKLMAPQYVKPYVKTNKNDSADAEAICEAVTRPNMRFVPQKSVDAQDMQSLHRARKRIVRNMTALTNEARGLLSEYGIIINKGPGIFSRQIGSFLEDDRLTPSFKTTLRDLYEEYLFMKEKLKTYDQRLVTFAKTNERCKNLETIKGIGVITATALSTVEPSVFRNSREFAAWLGLTPRQHSTGGKERLLGISKRGDPYLRELLVHGARVFLRWADIKNDGLSLWVRKVKERRGHNKACVAMANKLARIAWKVMIDNREFKVA